MQDKEMPCWSALSALSRSAGKNVTETSRESTFLYGTDSDMQCTLPTTQVKSSLPVRKSDKRQMLDTNAARRIGR